MLMFWIVVFFLLSNFLILSLSLSLSLYERTMYVKLILQMSCPIAPLKMVWCYSMIIYLLNTTHKYRNIFLNLKRKCAAKCCTPNSPLFNAVLFVNSFGGVLFDLRNTTHINYLNSLSFNPLLIFLDSHFFSFW